MKLCMEVKQRSFKIAATASDTGLVRDHRECKRVVENRLAIFQSRSTFYPSSICCVLIGLSQTFALFHMLSSNNRMTSHPLKFESCDGYGFFQIYIPHLDMSCQEHELVFFGYILKFYFTAFLCIIK